MNTVLHDPLHLPHPAIRPVSSLFAIQNPIVCLVPRESASMSFAFGFFFKKCGNLSKYSQKCAFYWVSSHTRQDFDGFERKAQESIVNSCLKDQTDRPVKASSIFWSWKNNGAEAFVQEISLDGWTANRYIDGGSKCIQSDSTETRGDSFVKGAPQDEYFLTGALGKMCYVFTWNIA